MNLSLIHRWHWETRQERPSFGLGRPTGVDLIEGNRRQVLAFLDALTYGDASTPGIDATKLAWQQHRQEVQARQVTKRARSGDNNQLVDDDKAHQLSTCRRDWELMSIQYQVLGNTDQDNALFVRVDSGQTIHRVLFDCGEECPSAMPFADLLALDHLLFSHLHMASFPSTQFPSHWQLKW